MKLKFPWEPRKPNCPSHVIIVGWIQSQPPSSPFVFFFFFKSASISFAIMWLRFIQHGNSLSTVAQKLQHFCGKMNTRSLSYILLIFTLSFLTSYRHCWLPRSATWVQQMLPLYFRDIAILLGLRVYLKALQRKTTSTVLHLSLLLSPQRGTWRMIPLAVMN